MRILLIIILMSYQAVAATLGGTFVRRLCESRPQFDRYLADGKSDEWDPKNQVVSWIINYINLLHNDDNIRVFFDDREPRNQRLSEYITRIDPDIGEIVVIRVSSDEKHRFEDVFFSLIGSLIKADHDERLQKLKNDFFTDGAASKADIIAEFVELNHLTLFEIGKLRKDVFKEWGQEHELFAAATPWQSVDEGNFDKWSEDASNQKTKDLLHKNAILAYEGWVNSKNEVK